jgi:hypothetical protein
MDNDSGHTFTAIAIWSAIAVGEHMVGTLVFCGIVSRGSSMSSLDPRVLRRQVKGTHLLVQVIAGAVSSGN